MARIQIFCIITIGLMCRIGTINSAVTAGYFYDNPIRPYNPASFSPPLPSTGHYSFGQKVETTTQARLKVPPIPSLPPLTTYKPAQTTRYQSPYGRIQPTLNTYRTPQQQVQQGQGFQQQRIPQQQQITQFQRTQQINVQPSQLPYFYPKPQVPVSTLFTNNQQNTNNQQYPYTIQQRNNNVPQFTTRPTTTQLYSRITPTTTTATPTLQIQRQTPKSPLLNVVPQVATASVVEDPTTAAVINTDSNPTQIVATGLPEFYVVDGRQLKQYKVYENIDNDIDQEVQNFIPANFFLSSYHSMIGDTHPLGEDVQVQNRATSFQQSTQQLPRSQQLQQQQQQQQIPNTVALGSGGLGFVKLPNGNVYLGSGSLGYISNLQHSQEVQDLRSRTSSSGPDALHFGHGPLSDSFYYQNQKD